MHRVHDALTAAAEHLPEAHDDSVGRPAEVHRGSRIRFWLRSGNTKITGFLWSR